jgi:hypothetical protein
MSKRGIFMAAQAGGFKALARSDGFYIVCLVTIRANRSLYMAFPDACLAMNTAGIGSKDILVAGFAGFTADRLIQI